MVRSAFAHPLILLYGSFGLRKQRPRILSAIAAMACLGTIVSRKHCVNWKEEHSMAYDPNQTNRPDLRTPDLRNTTEIRPKRSSSWMTWVAILAVVVVGAFVWSQMGGSTATDQTTTSSTTPPAQTQSAPAPAPMTPATPPAGNNAAPAAPANGGNGGTSQP
jgi:hypothetical protein